MTRMGVKDGIYICSREEFKGLSHVLREELIKMNKVISAQANRQDKKEMLYNSLTSEDFGRQAASIISSYTQMKGDLEKEKTAMMKHWKYREKQLDNIKESLEDQKKTLQDNFDEFFKVMKHSQFV